MKSERSKVREPIVLGE